MRYIREGCTETWFPKRQMFRIPCEHDGGLGLGLLSNIALSETSNQKAPLEWLAAPTGPPSPCKYIVLRRAICHLGLVSVCKARSLFRSAEPHVKVAFGSSGPHFHPRYRGGAILTKDRFAYSRIGAPTYNPVNDLRAAGPTSDTPGNIQNRAGM
ncbi:hypothetical protein OE88DRAFT_493894 [Heliocybe sulcata]|uniref:Uncharacterized protein n=1 Tax=Heliocybe sulcata TaxID=5364 RepID=A0A5C3MV74_9AGAM|nr:hypothetical protein OE88DRAFT_493894 [Heliocybe sulcata]